MEIESAEDMRKGREEFLKRFMKRKEALLAGKQPSNKDAIKEKEGDLDRLRMRIKKLNAAKAQAVTRFDEDISRCEQEMTRLETDIRTLQDKTEDNSAKIAKTASKMKKALPRKSTMRKKNT